MPRLPALCAAALAAFVGTLAGASAEASCTGAALQGTWVAQTPAARGVTRIAYAAPCAGDDTGDRTGANTVQLWAPCAPSDCDWGALPAQAMKSGWHYSLKDDGYAQRHIFMRLTEANHLHVYIKTDFSDPARPDYDQDAIFVKF